VGGHAAGAPTLRPHAPFRDDQDWRRHCNNKTPGKRGERNIQDRAGQNRIRPPVTGSARLPFTRGAVTSTALATVGPPARSRAPAREPVLKT